MLAQELLEQPKMSNHARGLWGYTGTTPAGDRLTVQATGMGGPSAAVVLADLEELGVRRVVRVGTCAALVADLALGDLLVVDRALPGDGVSRLLGAGHPAPDPGLLALLAGAGTPEVVRSGELPARLLARHAPQEGAEGAGAHDLQTAGLLAMAAALEVAAAAVLIVAEDLAGGRIADEDLDRAAKQAGKAAAEALSNPRSEP